MMPFIQLEGGRIKKEQKEKLISELTRVSSEILGIPEDVFLVLIKENDWDSWGTGGKVLSKVVAERAKKA
jgi:4-oxalocrotonate tautomerase